MKTIIFHVSGDDSKNPNPFFTNRSRAKKGTSTTSFVSRNDKLTVFTMNYADFKKHYQFDRSAWIYRKQTDVPVQSFATIEVTDN